MPALSHVLTAALALSVLSSAPVPAQDNAAIRAEIAEVFGFVPSFVDHVPPAALPGAWAEVKAMELTDTALTVQTKALIAIAVAAQIPCEYCLFLDRMTAEASGATPEMIDEAIAIAALTRHWSTIMNGYGQDIDAFRAEFGVTP